MRIQFLVSLLFALIIAIFSASNFQSVEVHLFWYTYSTPLVVVIIGSAFLGGLLTYLMGLYRDLKKSWTLQKLNRRMKASESEKTNEPKEDPKESPTPSGN